MADPPPFLRDAMQSPCIRDLFGIQLAAWEQGSVTLTLDRRPELGHVDGWFQGAITTAIAEYCASLSAMTITPDRRSQTIQQNIHFTGAARGDRLIAKGRILSSARTVTMVEASVLVEREGALHPCATLTMTMLHADDGRSGGNA